MSNFRKLHYDNKSGKVGISVKNKIHYFDKSSAFDATAKIPGHFGVNVNGQNFFFPINENMQNGAVNPYWSIEDNKVSRTIPPLYFPRIITDLQYWRLVAAEMEMKPWNWRVKAQTLLQDVALDLHVMACWGKRKRMTLKKKPCFFDANGNPVEDKNLEFINEHWWYQLIDFMLDAQAFGYNLIELGELINGKFPDISVVPRQNISPDREVVAGVVYNVNGICFNFSSSKQDVPAGKGNSKGGESGAGKAMAKAPNGEYYYDWHVWVKTPNIFGAHTSSCGYGLFYLVAQAYLLAKLNLQYNSDYVEKFGQPIPYLKTSKTDPKERQDAFDDLVKMGSSSAFLSDLSDVIELLFPSSIGSGHQIFGNFEERMQKLISAILLGHQDVMHSIPGKAGSMEDNPINKSMLEVENEQDKWISAMVMENVIPKLQNLGFKIPEGIKYGYLNDEQDNLQKETQNKHNLDFAKVVQTLEMAGFEVEPEFIEEQTGIPVKKVVPQINAPEKIEPEQKEFKDYFDKLKNAYK